MERTIMVAVLVLLVVLSISPAAEKMWKTTGQVSSSPSQSSIVLPLQGDVYPKGYYFAQVYIGKPPKPYFLDPDTGSDLTWLQCDAPCRQCLEAPHPLYKPNNKDVLRCNDSLCKSLQPSEQKSEPLAQCDYEVGYADGSSSLGVLLRDSFSLNLSNGNEIAHHLALGCGYDQVNGDSYYHPIDGVLGLGKGPTSILSQLKEIGVVRNIVGHCLSGKGGGYLFFGDEVYDALASHIVWTQMLLDNQQTHYSPGLAELFFNGTRTKVKKFHVTFDSGSSFSYLHSEAYQYFISLVEKGLIGKPLRRVDDDITLPLCWKGNSKPFKSVQDVKQYFKPFALRFYKSFWNFWNPFSDFEISPESYLIISSKGNVCLGMLNGTELGLGDTNIIGDISMQDKMVIYDNEKNSIGWIPRNCSYPIN